MIRNVFGLIFTILFLVSCTKDGQKASPQQEAEQAKVSIKVGLVLDKGGKDDKSFNTAAFKGATDAVRDFKIDLKDVETPDDSAFEPAIRRFAEREFALIIAVGFSQSDALKKVAPMFPNTHFAIVDGHVEGSNVTSLKFAEHEGSFLVGYLAGMMTKSGTLGFIGGMDIPLIRRFQMGYESGIKAARPDAKLLSNYAGVNSSAWINPNLGKELAKVQYGKGADIIFAAAGATGLGVFDAAEEKSKFAIGVDSNQNGIRPGRIVTSMLKRVDTAVYQVIKDQVKNKFKPGVRSFGLADKGIDYSVDEHNEKLIAPFRDKLEEIRKKVLDGQIKVPDYYEVNKGK